MRWLITNVFLLGMAVAILIHLILATVYEGYFIAKPNIIELTSEIVLLIGIMTLAIFNLTRIKE